MSYDINIWSIDPPEAAEAELAATGFVKLPGGGYCLEGKTYCLEGKTWLINLAVHGVIEEDVPDEVKALQKGVAHLTEITVEPASAPPGAYAVLQTVTKLLSQKTVGIIEDKQDGSYTLPSGKKVVPAPKEKPRVSVLVMSWWMENSRLATRDGMREFIGLLQKYLPEAVPRRYGLYEPPKFKFAETGLEHFLDLYTENTRKSGVICVATKPVLNLYFGVKEACGFMPIGKNRKYRCNYVKITLDADVLGDKKWQETLLKAWEELSIALKPFYGDVRILKNYIKHGGQPHSDSKTEHHPVKAWWWQGVPAGPAQAMVVGSPYTALWPGIDKAGKENGGLYFVSPELWRNGEDIGALIGKTPADIAMPPSPEGAVKVSTPYSRLIAKLLPKEAKPAAVPTYVLPKVFPFKDA